MNFKKDLFTLKSPTLLLVIAVLFFLLSIKVKLTQENIKDFHSLKFLSNQEQVDLKLNLLDSISQAHQKIVIWVYSLTDPSILNLLNKKAGEGVEIEVIIDRKSYSFVKKKLDSNILVTQVPQKGLMHKKIFVIDDEIFIGSSNLTTTSLRMHDNLMCRFHHPKLLSYLQDSHYKKTPFQFIDEELGLKFFTLPSKEALEEIIKLIDSAKFSIDLALFTFTHPLLNQKIIEAHKRGVQVRTLIDFLSNKGASRFVSAELLKSRVPLFTNRGTQLMHHKMAWIDQEVLIFGSTNWTQSAFEKNQDDLLILKLTDPKSKKQINQLLKHLFWESKPIR